MKNAHNLIIVHGYDIHDIKYISDGRCLEVQTVAKEIETMLVQSSTIKDARLYDLGHEDQYIRQYTSEYI